MWGRKRQHRQAPEVRGFEVPEAACPACGHVMNSAAPMGGSSSPRVGDISVCSGCGALLQYTPAMGLEALPEAAFNKLRPWAKGMLRRAQAIIQKHRAVMAA